MIRFVKRYEARRRASPQSGMSYVHGDLPGRSLFRSPADWVAPHDISHLTDPPAANAEGDPLPDADHHCGGCGDATFPWRVFTRGYNPLFMDEMTREPRAEQIRLAMGNTRRYASRNHPGADGAARRPLLDGLLPRLARTRVPRLPAGRPGMFSVDLTPAAGRTFGVEWMHPVTGRITHDGPVEGGGSRTLRPPFAGPAVAYLRRR